MEDDEDNSEERTIRGRDRFILCRGQQVVASHAEMRVDVHRTLWRVVKRIALFPLAPLLLSLTLSGSAFAQDAKASYAILIDNTGSLRSQFSVVLMIGRSLVELTHQRASISLFHFKSEGDGRDRLAVVTSGTGWTQDKTLLHHYINSLYVVPGQTTLMDAINSIAQQLNARTGPDKDAEKIIFIVSDGEDRVSKTKEKQLIKTLKESGIKVYAVGLVDELRPDGFPIRSQKGSATAFLKKITKETGGRVVFPTPKQTDIDALLRELIAR